VPTVASETPELSIAYRLHASELISTLRTDERQGLGDEEARARLAQYGPNRALFAGMMVASWKPCGATP
jgi:cation transport ATPase-like protein